MIKKYMQGQNFRRTAEGVKRKGKIRYQKVTIDGKEW